VLLAQLAVGGGVEVQPLDVHQDFIGPRPILCRQSPGLLGQDADGFEHAM
jgi:hypothetical protein